jgi:hypothetical protein
MGKSTHSEKGKTRKPRRFGFINSEEVLGAEEIKMIKEYAKRDPDPYELWGLRIWP